jgi:CubicO group peptidase (beta-lactamase class C family)
MAHDHRYDTTIHLPKPLPKDEQIDGLIRPYVYSLGSHIKKPSARSLVPGAAVVVRQNDQIVHLNCYGYANLETKEEIKPTTVFDLGSLSKQFTAMAVLGLVFSKQIKLEHKLSKFFDMFPGYADNITIKDLIHHTSGLPEYSDLHVAAKVNKDWYDAAMSRADDWYPRMLKRKRREKSNNDVLDWIASEKILATTPGAEFEYSNSGYVILAQVVAKVADMRFADLLKEGIFDTVGMNDTYLFDERSRFRKDAPEIVNHARCYNLVKGKRFIPVGYTPLNFVYGDGNVHSTIRDLAKWELRLHQLDHASFCSTSKSAQSRAKRIRELLWSPVREHGHPQVNYGAGWNLLRERFTHEFDEGGRHYKQDFEMIAEYHRGEWLGWRSYIARASRWLIPRKGKEIDPASWDSLGIVVLANCGQFNACAAVQKVSQNYWGDLKKVNIMNRFNCGGEWNQKLV